MTCTDEFGRILLYANPGVMDATDSADEVPGGHVPQATQVWPADRPEHANLVGSYCPPQGPSDPDDWTDVGKAECHRPVLDLDFPVRFVPSSTNHGGGHLYLDGIALTAAEHQKLLDVLTEVRILQKGVHYFSTQRGMTVTRRPGVTKGNSLPPGCGQPGCPCGETDPRYPVDYQGAEAF